MYTYVIIVYFNIYSKVVKILIMYSIIYLWLNREISNSMNKIYIILYPVISYIILYMILYITYITNIYYHLNYIYTRYKDITFV